MLIDIIAIDSSKLFEDLTFMSPSHLLLVVTLFDSSADLLLQLLLHVLRYIRFLLHEHGHAVHVVLLLVKSKLVEALRLALLIVVFLRGLLLLNFLLGLLQLLIDRLKHILLLFGNFLLLFLRVYLEQLIRDGQEAPEVGILDL